jgi:tellurite resistance protein TerC
VVLVWIAFICLLLSLLALDLGVFHRKSHAISVREGVGWSLVWMALAIAFAAFVYAGYEQQWLGLGTAPDAVERTAGMPHGRPNDGGEAVVKYLTGYIVEKSLSIDNIFVIAMLFRFLAVPPAYQHRVLFWGILGALAMRGVMIAIGATLVTRFAWVLYVFGVFLIATAVKMMFLDTEQRDPGTSVVVRLTRRVFPITRRYHGRHFVIRRAGTIMLTPLAVALIMVETTDLLFAVDSIPAIFAITADPFLVFTSNAFAILGLRSLYFVLAGALDTFRYLKASLALVLALVGVKMIAHGWLKEVLGAHFTLYVLAAVLLILAGGVIASLLASRAERTSTFILGSSERSSKESSS